MDDTFYMRRCFQLALLGAGQVSPNPLVGAVLVYEGKIIAESWHKKWGEAHAEVNCLRAVRPEHQALVPKATMYCNLEPCSHFGKTPPCADLLIQHKIRRVVVANTDPNPLVAGRGLAKLHEAGIEVVEGVLAAEGLWLNRVFFTWINEKRPYVLLKWAQSADKFMSRKGERSAISSPPALRLVHRWRAAYDAILVGSRTAGIDNPRLDVRYYFGKKPLRVAFDRQGKMPESHHLFDDTQETWIFTDIDKGKSANFAHTTLLPLDGSINMAGLLERLREANRSALMVEGGAATLRWFLAENSWDEIRIIENRRTLGSGIAAPEVPEAAVLKRQFEIGDDHVRIFAR